MDPHLFRLALATPLASGILEVADEFLFLVSTEITAWPSARAAPISVLM